MTPLEQYRALEAKLRAVRGEYGAASLHEDPILDEMSRVWWQLSDAERAMLDAEGPTCDLLRVGAGVGR